MVTVMVRVSRVIAKFHYTGPTGPDQTKSADFVRENINTYFFKQNVRKQFYQTALGNCYGLKLAKC